MSGGAILGVAMVDAEVRVVPKMGLNLAEVEWAFGSSQVARQLKEIGALRPVPGSGRTLLFDKGHVEDVWSRYAAGEYFNQLENLKSA